MVSFGGKNWDVCQYIGICLEHSLTKVYTDAKDIILPLELLLSIFHSMKSLIFCRGRKKEEGRGGAAGEVG